MISNEERLAQLIKQEIRDEFAVFHLSGNLADTVEVKRTENGWSVEIPARIYDIHKWRETGMIVYLDESSSYAGDVDTYGGFSGMHVGFIDRCIKNAIQRLKNELSRDNKVEVEGI